ncbi:hypothetical protein VNO77_12129 [Canavalia gladiata]|uniref:Cotton fiber protein n=1 Tax=Canavalia gladiata TaxID=3824 RepID=A0AAN9QPV1_CANGL
MPRKGLPVFHKVSNLLRLSLLIQKLRKPIISKLKIWRRRSEFKLLKHYNYRFHGEYQFSPSSTPLIHHHRFKNRGHADLCSFFYLYWCLGNLKVQGSEALPALAIEIEDGVVADDLFGSGDDESESIDEKAERFIQRFYQEMRMQRQESI